MDFMNQCWTLSAMALLTFAFFGSKFVLDMVS